MCNKDLKMNDAIKEANLVDSLENISQEEKKTLKKKIFDRVNGLCSAMFNDNIKLL